MTVATLALISLIALAGPALATPSRWRVPVVVGELGAGVLFGPDVAGLLDPGNSTFAFLAEVGFALVMFVAGSHVPVRDSRLVAAIRAGTVRALAVGAQAQVLRAGEGAALIFGALITIAASALVTSRLSRPTLERRDPKP